MKAKEKLCEHPKNMRAIINNGGIYCKKCSETNILKQNRVLNNDGKVVFEGDGIECNKWINKQQGF